MAPTRTVTVIVCGASTAFASLTVTIPVYTPALNPEVFRVNCSGRQLATELVLAQARAAPTAVVIQETEDDRVSDNEPSLALYASTTWLGELFPAPTGIGPTVLELRRSIGAA
jgi:hypothetical protein